MRVSSLSTTWRTFPPAPGFTLIELALVLVVVGLLLAVGAYTLPSINEEGSLEKTRLVMTETADAVLAFSLTNNRLPCPADPALSTGDAAFGEEDCSQNRMTGLVPHETLLLSGPVLDTAHRAIVYTVYRNGPNADLARVVNLFDGVDEPVPVLNVYDYCQALKNAGAAAGSGLASTTTSFAVGGCAGGAVINQAFVLAGAGLEDADGDGDPFDGNNADATPVCFASPQQGRDASYDDLVHAVSFAAVLGRVCP